MTKLVKIDAKCREYVAYEGKQAKTAVLQFHEPLTHHEVEFLRRDPERFIKWVSQTETEPDPSPSAA